MKQTFEPDKFKQLILYLSERSEADPKYGQVKLNKLLYYIDFLAYRDLGKPITGARYQRLKWGPAAVALKPVQTEMVDEGSLLIRSSPFGGFEQKKPIALQTADMSAFTGNEVAFVEFILSSLKELGAGQVSDLSHEDIGWKLARDGEDIPYETVFVDWVIAAPAAS